jgi:hypothetical protein
VNKRRDALFLELFERIPTAEEIRRFDRMGALMSLANDDSMWYVILVNEFYDHRLKSRLAEIDEAANNAAGKVIAKMASAVNEKADAMAERRNRGYSWRSWGFAHSLLVVLCSGVLSAGYVMGGGKHPFWLNPENSFERVSGWFLNVPAGWIFLLGSTPFLFERFWDSLESLRTGSGRIGAWEGAILAAKAACAFCALVFAFLVVLAF